MRSKIVAVAAGVLTAAGLGLAPSASAAPVEETAASCSFDTCTGLDPVAQGCVADSVVREFAYSESDGVIEIRWSRACGAQYARLVHSSPGARLSVWDSSGKSYEATVPAGSTTVISPLLPWIASAASGDTVYISW